MNRQEHVAWFNLAVIAVALAVFLLLIPVLGPKRATGAFGILGLLGLSPLLAWRRRGSTEVMGDERDAAINSKATLIAFAVFWVTFIVECMVPYWIVGPQGSIPSGVMPLVALVGFLVFQGTQSAATVVQYARGRQHARG